MSDQRSGTALPFREWFVFYIDPEKDDHVWRTAGMLGGPYTADEAIQKTVGRMFTRPFWAFALSKGEHGSYYDLHYPEGVERPYPRRIGPGGYIAEPKS